MLDSLHIQNYRLFKDLKIEKLGQVNLISGKNNCGKTALLEALRIFKADAKGLGTVINNIIYNRGSWQYENRDLDSYLSLFHEKQEGTYIEINDKRFGISKPLDGQILMFANGYAPSFIQFGKGTGYTNPKDNVFYIAFNADSNNFIPYFDSIVLNNLEAEVVKILQIINPKITNYKILASNKEIQIDSTGIYRPIKEEGDGLKRLLIMAAGLVLSKNKILLIDEFEVGLHHSIQEQLWEIIFKYAKEWNIQVFVTTHSLDTVRAFAEVSDKFEGMGEYMRLQKSRTTDDIEAVVYSKKSLEYAIDDSLEMR